MTPKQVAGYLNISVRTVYIRWKKLGGLKIGRTLRFRKELIDALFRPEEKKVEGGGEARSERYTRAFKTKTEAKCWEVEKWKDLENPNPIAETGMDFLTACNEYLDYSKLRFSSMTYGEKKKLCRTLLRKWGNPLVNDVTPMMVMKHLGERRVMYPTMRGTVTVKTFLRCSTGCERFMVLRITRLST